MRVLLINLPSPRRLMRRYVASYHAPNFLLPPLELMGLGAVARRHRGCQVRLLDCVARGIGLVAAARRAADGSPDVVVAMLGFEACAEDLAALTYLRRTLWPARVFCFGYLATQLPAEILAQGACDGVLLDEPELTFAELLERLERGESTAGLPGLARRCDGQVRIGAARGRITDLDALPWADHSLVELSSYSESFMPRPMGVIMSARGCSYPCTFCVRTFGRQVVFRSAANLAAEVESLRQVGIRHVRFMDDTFTIDRDRILDVCDRLRRLGDITWTALTRAQALDCELLDAMWGAGCRRLYVGVESGSQRILDQVRKELTVEEIREMLPRIQGAGIEVSAFFIVGVPGESESDVEASLQLALELQPEYIIVTRLQYWPGTELFEAHRERLHFSLRPTCCEAIPGSGIPSPELSLQRERRFYRRFYLRAGYLTRRLSTLARTPRDCAEGMVRLTGFVASRQTSQDFI